MREILIWDNKSEPTRVLLQDKPIVHIHVSVLSYSEVITIVYEDGEIHFADSAPFAKERHHNGDYLVTADRLDDWINRGAFICGYASPCLALERLREFGGRNDGR